MSSFDLNRLQAITGVGPVSAADRAKTQTAQDPRGSQGAQSSIASAASSAGVAVEIETQVEARAPVDTDRVTEIRRALREGSYPLVPTKIADAMIAAQFSYEGK